MGCELLATGARKGYIQAMEPISTEELRAFFARYLERKGQGAMKRAVQATKVSRQHLNRFKRGKTDMGWDTRKLLLELMQEEGFAPRPAVAQESRPPYAPESTPEPTIELVLALRLEAMAKELLCLDLTPTKKAEHFLEFVESLADSLQTYIAALQKSTYQRN